MQHIYTYHMTKLYKSNLNMDVLNHTLGTLNFIPNTFHLFIFSTICTRFNCSAFSSYTETPSFRKVETVETSVLRVSKYFIYISYTDWKKKNQFLIFWKALVFLHVFMFLQIYILISSQKKKKTQSDNWTALLSSND